MGLSGEVGEEDEAGGEGPVVHGFVSGPKGGAYMDVGVAEPMLLSFRAWCVLCDAYVGLNDLRLLAL